VSGAVASNGVRCIIVEIAGRGHVITQEIRRARGPRPPDGRR
jgi:hypothetical protein